MAISFKPGGAAPATKGPVGRSGVLYGPPFSGKTSTLQYDPSIRVLLIDFDKNSSVIEHCKNVDIIGVNKYDEYLTIKEGVETGKMVINGQAIPMNYDLYIFESVTRFEEIIKEWVVITYAPKRSREIKEKFGAQTDWADLQDTEIRQVRDWQSMTRRPNNPINVLWIGHDMNAPTTDGFNEKLQLRLQGKYAAPGIMSAVDAVFYMYKVKDETSKKMGFGIYTMDAGAIQAEARLSFQKREEMPEIIWWPKWGDVYRQLGATNLDKSQDGRGEGK